MLEVWRWRVRIPRITVEVGDRVLTEEYRGHRTHQDIASTPDNTQDTIGDEVLDTEVLAWEAGVRKNARNGPRTKQTKRTGQGDQGQTMSRLQKKARTQDVDGTQDINPPPTTPSVTPAPNTPAPPAPPAPTEDDYTHCPLGQDIAQDKEIKDKAQIRPMDLPPDAEDKLPQVPRPPEVPHSPPEHRVQSKDKSPVLVDLKTTAAVTRFTSTDIRYRTVSQALMAGAKIARDSRLAARTKDTKVKGARGPPSKPGTKPTLGRTQETGAGRSRTAAGPFRAGHATSPSTLTGDLPIARSSEREGGRQTSIEQRADTKGT